jgi:hypothetical protein
MYLFSHLILGIKTFNRILVIVVVDMLQTLDLWKKQKMSLKEYVFFCAKYKNVNESTIFIIVYYFLEIKFDFVFELL